MRFLTIGAATAVAASITIPAVAGGRGEPDADAKFVSCLRAEGAGIPAGTRGMAIKTWLRAHPEAESALAACTPSNGPKPQDLIACLRAQGLQPPAALDALKPWLAGQSKDVLRACDIVPKESCGAESRPADAPAAKDS